MVLMNGTKRARNVSSTIANADNRCNGGMKKAGMAPTAGWMRKLNGVKKNYYFVELTHCQFILKPKKSNVAKGDKLTSYEVTKLDASPIFSEKDGLS